MNRVQTLACFLIAFGIGLFLIGLVQGDVQTGIIVVFPFIMGTSAFAAAGMLLVFLGIVLFFYGGMKAYESMHGQLSKEDTAHTSVKIGGVVLIGPIPIIWGSNWKITLIMILAALLLLVILTMIFVW